MSHLMSAKPSLPAEASRFSSSLLSAVDSCYSVTSDRGRKRSMLSDHVFAAVTIIKTSTNFGVAGAQT